MTRIPRVPARSGTRLDARPTSAPSRSNPARFLERAPSLPLLVIWGPFRQAPHCLCERQRYPCVGPTPYLTTIRPWGQPPHTLFSPIDNIGRLQQRQVLQPQARLFCLSVSVLPRLDVLVGRANSPCLCALRGSLWRCGERAHPSGAARNQARLPAPSRAPPTSGRRTRPDIGTEDALS